MTLPDFKKGMWMAGWVLCLAVSPLAAQREMKTLNDSWEFRMPDAEQWERVNLPHTYNLDAYDGPRYYQGKALYRRTLALPEVEPGRRYYLKIDAASKAADVSLNGVPVGSHAGGYSAFTLDVTDRIRTENLIEITVDNGRKDITPISADFTFWGGIYRDVWLISLPEQHFNMANMGSSGVFVSTPEVSAEQAVVRVRDKGRGIPAEELARVTEPFYMVDRSRARAQNGSGFGLALCARIAKLHGGELAIESEVGKGTTVRFDLKEAGR